VTTEDPFELLQSHVPFDQTGASRPSDAAKKAAMYKEITMNTALTDSTEADAVNRDPHTDGRDKVSFRPTSQPPSSSANASTGHRPVWRRTRTMVAAAAFVVLAMVGTVVSLPGQNSNIAYALDRLDLTALATSGEVEVSRTITAGDRGAVEGSTRFVYDGEDATLIGKVVGIDGVPRTSHVVDGVGYKNYVASDQVGDFTSSSLFDRKRLFGPFANNLASVAEIRTLIEAGENVTRTDLGDGTEVVEMTVDVGAGFGEKLDFATFDQLPTSVMLAPFGNFTLEISITIIGDYVDVISYSANGSRPALENPEEIESLVATGTIDFSGINEPQEIVAPSEATPAAGIDEWVLLSGDEWAAHGNFLRADRLYPDSCTDFDRNWETLLGPLSDSEKNNFTGLADCFTGIEERGISASIRALINLHN